MYPHPFLLTLALSTFAAASPGTPHSDPAGPVQAAGAARVPTLCGAATLPVADDDPELGGFQSALDAAAAYDLAYRDYVANLTYEVATVTRPDFPDTEDVRAVIAAHMDEPYELGTTWISSTRPAGGDFTVATSTAGRSAAIDQLQLIPFEALPLDLTVLPPQVAAVFATVALDSYSTCYYSARFDGVLTHSGIALLSDDETGEALWFWPEGVEVPGSVFSGQQTAVLRALDAQGAVDWDALLDLLYPVYDPPLWTPQLGPPGVAGPASDEFWECVYQMYLAYKQAMADDAAQSETWARANAEERSSKVLVNAQERDSVNAAFRAAGGQGTHGGMTHDEWDDYLDSFWEKAQDEFMDAEADRKAWEENRRCLRANQFRDGVLDCLGTNEYPELVEYMDAWLAGQGC